MNPLLHNMRNPDELVCEMAQWAAHHTVVQRDGRRRVLARRLMICAALGGLAACAWVWPPNSLMWWDRLVGCVALLTIMAVGRAVHQYVSSVGPSANVLHDILKTNADNDNWAHPLLRDVWDDPQQWHILTASEIAHLAATLMHAPLRIQQQWQEAVASGKPIRRLQQTILQQMWLAHTQWRTTNI